jgi:hypothetical protein
VSCLPDLADLRRALADRTETPEGVPVHLRAYTWWMLGRTGWQTNVVAEVGAATGAARRPDHAAAIGFACYAQDAPPANRTFVRELFEWLSARQYFLPHRPHYLEQDGVALLGLSLALRSLPDLAQFRRWLIDLTIRSLELLPSATWDSALTAAAHCILDPSQEPHLLPTMLAEVAVALRSKGLLESYGTKGPSAWTAITAMHGLEESAARAATLLLAFDRLVADSLPARLTNIEIDDVRRLALALPRAVQRWTWDDAARTPRSAPGRWEIENEYHVQNLLWAILSPIFPDLDDEEYLKSIGQRQPRYDLAVPSLSLIIEAKFIRPGTSFSKVIGKIAEDVTLYLRRDTPWRSLIPVVWDDAARTEEHHEFLRGLRSMEGIAEAVVISRPARMVRKPITIPIPRKRQNA